MEDACRNSAAQEPWIAVIATVAGLTPAGLRFGVEVRLGLYRLVGSGRLRFGEVDCRPPLAVWCVFASALEQYSPSKKRI